MPDPIPLAEEIVRARKLLDELWEAASAQKDKKKIAKQQEVLDVQMMRLISINIRQRGEEYDKATKSITEANEKVEKAIRDLDRIADALEKVATALDFIAEVKPA